MRKYFTLAALMLYTSASFAISPMLNASGDDIFMDKTTEKVHLNPSIVPNRLSFKTTQKVFKSDLALSPVELNQTSRAEAEENPWNLSYAIPEGAFYTNISYLQTIKKVSNGEVLQSRRINEQTGFMVPPFVELTWTNLVQKTSFNNEGSNTEWLPDTETLDWVLFNGDYTDAYIYNRFDSKAYDLKSAIKPSMADSPLMAPAFFHGNDVYQMVDASGQYATQMFVGDARFSEDQLANITDEFTTTLNNAEKTPVIVTISEAKNGRSTLYDDDNWMTLPLNSRMAVGNESGILFNGLTANEAFKLQWEESGLKDFTFDGFYERIPASPADYIAKSLEISCLYYGPKNPPITYCIYDISGDVPNLLMQGEMTPTEELTVSDEKDADGNPLYGGQITLEATLEDVFSAEGFLNVKADKELIIEFLGGDNVALFAPWMTQYDFSKGPDRNTFRNLAGAIVLNADGEMGMIPMNYYYAKYAVDPVTGKETEEITGYYKHTSFMVALDIEYPYLAAFSRYIPASRESNGVTYYGQTYDFFGDEKDAVDIQFLDFISNEADPTGNLTGNIIHINSARYNLISNAKAADIELTYSDDAVKNAINARVIDGNPISSSTSKYNAGYVCVILIPNPDVTIPSTGWIKASYKGHEVTFNLTETSAIEDIESDVINDIEAVATEYFDLQGRKLAGDANGIVIKKMTMADGSVKAVKVVK